MGEKERPEQTVDLEQTVRMTLEILGPLPPWRAVLDKSRNDEFAKLHQKHWTRFIEQKERISNDDARVLVGLWLDLDPSCRNPGIAHNYAKWGLASSLLDSDNNPDDEAVEVYAEESRTSALHWDALKWTVAYIDGKRPLGQALSRWMDDVNQGKCPRPRHGTRGPLRKMTERNKVDPTRGLPAHAVRYACDTQ